MGERMCGFPAIGIPAEGIGAPRSGLGEDLGAIQLERHRSAADEERGLRQRRTRLRAAGLALHAAADLAQIAGGFGARAGFGGVQRLRVAGVAPHRDPGLDHLVVSLGVGPVDQILPILAGRQFLALQQFGRLIGASDNDIRRIFVIEASAIGLLGGLIGIALGWIVGRVINFGANIYIQSQGGTAGTLFSLPLWLIASAIAFSLLISLAAGSYPASRAARLDPIQALRHD